MSEINNVRTLGDGMESSSMSEFSFKYPEKPAQIYLNSMKIFIPKTLTKTVPKYIGREKNVVKMFTRKLKEPKFIPYEPYKAATLPILPQKKVLENKFSKNNIEIHHLVNQMKVMTASTELNKKNSFCNKNEEKNKNCSVVSEELYEKLKKNYENDVKNLRESNTVLKNQLKFQSQVNSELKTLLVAAVGEDLETRVQHLTEDKLQLARALLNSANHLTREQEQLEWLTGQCEVWKSKFLASSLMIEELARWKITLSERLKEMQNLSKKIIDDHRILQQNTLKTTYNLHEISNYLQVFAKNHIDKLTRSDPIVLSHLNLEISHNILGKFIEYDEGKFGKFYENSMMLPHKMQNMEKLEQLLQKPLEISFRQQHERLCKAVLDEAGSMTNDIGLGFPMNSLHSCSHCKGEVENI